VSHDAIVTTPRPDGPARSRIALAGDPDPRDLPGDFCHRRTVEVRFADTDAMGHVNNAAYLTFVEAARLDWWSEVTGEAVQREGHRAEGLILAEAEIAFRSPVLFGEVVMVETRATRIGRTSLAVEHRMTAGPPGGPIRLASIVKSVIVRYDYEAEKPVPWPPELVERIEAFEGRQLRPPEAAGSN
jgi:acyl-CoA thioester hydrolase